jgi:hypothetical protein
LLSFSLRQTRFPHIFNIVVNAKRNLLLTKDLLLGDEIGSDSYPIVEIDDVILEAQAKVKSDTSVHPFFTS